MPLGLQTAQLNFETLAEIGYEGRNSKVFKAHDKQLDGIIVVKQIEKSKMVSPIEYFAEAKILYNTAHQNIVKVNYGCEDPDYIWIAMPFYSKGSLKKLIDSRFLTIREVIRYSIQFLSGLNHIHTKKLIHFDVKPDNILISDANEALLSDFGLAKAMDILGIALNNLAYPKQIPPEAFNGSGRFNLQYDIYQAGLTLYRMVNGNSHFNAQYSFPDSMSYMAAVRGGIFPSRDNYLYHVPIALRKTINKALSVNLSERHKNCLELINELSACNDNLDWQYSEDSHAKNWGIIHGDFKTNIELKSRGGDFDIESTKENLITGNKTKITDGCLNGVKPTRVRLEIQRLIRLFQ